MNDLILDEPLRGHVDWLRRRHGLNQTGALLAALAPVLAAIGASRRILNPIDYAFVPAAMNLVLVGAGPLHAAVNLSLEPLRQWMLARVEPGNRVRLRIADLHQDLNHVDLLMRVPVPAAGISMTEEELKARRLVFRNQPMSASGAVKYPLRGKPVEYRDPFESAADGNWEALK